jgi:hypothetical protein
MAQHVLSLEVWPLISLTQMFQRHYSHLVRKMRDRGISNAPPFLECSFSSTSGKAFEPSSCRMLEAPPSGQLWALPIAVLTGSMSLLLPGAEERDLHL